MCEEELFDNTRVYWCQLFVFKKPTQKPTHLPCCQVPGSSVSTTEEQEAPGLLVKIQQQPQVLVLRAMQMLSPMLEHPVSSWLMDGRPNL